MPLQTVMTLTVRPLNADAFAPFGTVFSAGVGRVKTIRDGAVRLTFCDASLDHNSSATLPAVDLYEVAASRRPLTLARIERHPFSTQVFVPMQAVRWLVVVWSEHVVEPAAFVAGPRQAIAYAPSVWHHGIVALDAPAIFHSFMWRTGVGNDTEFLDLSAPVVVDWPAP